MRLRKVDPRDVRRLHEKGLKTTQIARELGVNRTSVNYHRRKMGLPLAKPGRPYTEAEVARLREMAQEGRPVREMAAALSRSYTGIRRKLSLSGIPYMRQPRGFQRYWEDQYMENHVPILEDYLSDPRQPWEVLAERHSVTVARVRTIVGRHLMKKCREAEDCAYRALLPEYKVEAAE